ncbi:polyunsaturated fatty acid 5-lipoxygenase [Nematostella vectensis]|uniref:polyunsaturated fatty acid 5-lipoxygenase n=1 Tax=Nematostella vectensis TaxID=45351 RepID=UPI00207797CF|nr:polyunsaturated fatty acid 5-lipoxygenase [Nematostella vectensis]
MWTYGLVGFLFFFVALQAVQINGFEKGYCKVSLPQYVTPACSIKRKAGLHKQQKEFKLNAPSAAMPYARLAVSTKGYPKFVKDKPMLSSHLTEYATMVAAGRKFKELYKNMTKGKPEEMTYRDFLELNKYMRTALEKAFGHKMRLPSEYEPFQMDVTKYLSDKYFTEQRLAGANPLGLQQVTLSDEVGLSFSNLKKNLNPNFNWKKAVGEALGRRINNNEKLKEVIEEGLLFALRYPLADDMVFMKDIVDDHANRTLWPFYSPIALFASVEEKPPKNWYWKRWGWKGSHTLKPVAIQMDYKPDSAVFTPKDGGKWTLAKLNVQVTDGGYSQMVDHLSHAHLVAEAVCVSMERHLSHKHPLYQMLKFHCRGVLTANVLGAPALLAPGQFMHTLYAYGWKGASKLVSGAAKSEDWIAHGFTEDLINRGVDDRGTLPYYPYRDDGKILNRALERFTKEYVQIYYKKKEDVLEDKELQAFAKEISVDGNGKIRRFPTSVRSVMQLRSIISRFLWIVVGRHTAVNYPLTDYVLYVPNAPTKLYNDSRAPADRFSLLNLPLRTVSETQCAFTSGLGTFRYDRLLDYASFLEDRAARRVVYRNFCRLNELVEPLLIRINNRRLKDGHLAYPYFIPRWLPNGIQT